MTAKTASTARTTQNTAATTPITILKRIQAAISRTTSATAFIPMFPAASLIGASLSDGSNGSLKEMRRAGRHVTIQTGQRDRAHDPARPVDREAEPAQAPQ